MENPLPLKQSFLLKKLCSMNLKLFAAFQFLKRKKYQEYGGLIQERKRFHVQKGQERI